MYYNILWLFYLFSKILFSSYSSYFISLSNSLLLSSASSIFIPLWLTYSSPTYISFLHSFYLSTYVFLKFFLISSISLRYPLITLRFFLLEVLFSLARNLIASMLENLLAAVLLSNLISWISSYNKTLVFRISVWTVSRDLVFSPSHSTKY